MGHVAAAWLSDNNHVFFNNIDVAVRHAGPIFAAIEEEAGQSRLVHRLSNLTIRLFSRLWLVHVHLLHLRRLKQTVHLCSLAERR